MKKVVTINGSPKAEQSTANSIINSLYKQIREIEKDVVFENFILSELDIKRCRGCDQCFLHCSPCLIYKDDIQKIESAMMEADIVIFASPVYAHNVTGEMKLFIDRISYSLHLMKYTGKYGVTITTSSSNGNLFVDDYLKKMMEHLGIEVIEQLSIKKVKQFDNSNIINCTNKMMQVFDDTIIIKVSESKEQIFGIYKKLYYANYLKSLSDPKIKLSKETEFWYKNGFFNYSSFQELFNNYKYKNTTTFDTNNIPKCT